MRYTLLVAVSVATLLCGCSEDPEKAAAKEVRKSSRQAREIIFNNRTQARRIIRQADYDSAKAAGNGDFVKANEIARTQYNKAQTLIDDGFEKALAEIENSLKNNRSAGKSKNSGLMTSANIIFSQALDMQAALPSMSAPIEFHVDAISDGAIVMGELAAMRSLRNEMIKAGQAEIRHYQDLLKNGTDERPSLNSQLNIEETKLKEIESKIAELKTQAQTAASEANKIEKAAADKLRQAEAASGDQKLTLQLEAYKLQSSKTKYSKQLQSAKDQISVLDSQAKVIAPVVTKLYKDIDSLEQKIAAIQNSPATVKLSEDLKEINSSYDNYSARLTKDIDGITAALNAYTSAFSKINTLFDQAAAQYDKIKGGLVSQTARSRKASCLVWKAGTYAQSIRTHKNLAYRLKSISADMEKWDPSISSKLATIINSSNTASVDQAAEAMKSYDLAITEYADISGSGNFDCAIRKCHILALYGKLALAEYLGNTSENKDTRDKNYAIADKALSDAEALVVKVKECDPGFSNSVTGKMLAGEIDYTPKLKVDMASHYDELRKKIQGWTALKGAKKKAEVERLITLLEGMKPAEDPEAFDRILEPELAQLIEAKNKGFDEDAGDDNFFSNDPNE